MPRGTTTVRRWEVDVQADGRGPSAVVPPGFVRDAASLAEADDEDDSAGQRLKNNALVEKQAWAMSTSQLQGIGMNAFMMYMVGNQLSLWTILMVGYATVKGVKGVLSAGSTFDKLPKAPGMDLTLPKLAYFGTQLLQLGVVVYKIGTMGLLPLTSADWVSLLPLRSAVEVSAGAIPIGRAAA